MIASAHQNPSAGSYLVVTQQAQNCVIGVTCWLTHVAPLPSGIPCRRCLRRTEMSFKHWTDKTWHTQLPDSPQHAVIWLPWHSIHTSIVYELYCWDVTRCARTVILVTICCWVVYSKHGSWHGTLHHLPVCEQVEVDLLTIWPLRGIISTCTYHNIIENTN